VSVPCDRRLTPEVVRLLRPAAGLTMPGAVQALVEIVSDIHVGLRDVRKPRAKPEPESPKRRRGESHPDQVGLFFDVLTVH